MKKKTVKRKAVKRVAKSSKGTTTLKKITAEAKKIYAANPNKKWTDCIKLASKKIKK